MRKLMSVLVAFAFALTLSTVAMAAPKKVEKKKIEAKTVKVEVIQVEKLKKGTLLKVKVDGKEHVYHVTKVALKDAEALKGGETAELTLHGMWVHAVKAEAAAPAAPAAAPAAPAAAPAAPAPAPAAPATK
jgi:2-oxoglutarate dehydrogenase E2 component (dihydrolipoamide succinyltransferase)